MAIVAMAINVLVGFVVGLDDRGWGCAGVYRIGWLGSGLVYRKRLTRYNDFVLE